MFGLPGSRQQKFLVLRFFDVKEQQGIDRLNIEKLDGNIVQSMEVQNKLGSNNLVMLSNDDTAVAQRRLEDKQPEEKINTDCLVKEQEKEYQTGWKIKTSNVLDSCNQSLVCPSPMQWLQGDEFDVEPQDDHTFEVEPHGNVDHVVGSQEVQTQDLIYYHPARDREQHSLLAEVTTSDAITGSLHQAEIWISRYAVKAKEYTWFKDHQGLSGNTQRVSHPESPMTNVGMLDKFDRGLQTDVQVFVDFDYAMAAYMTLTGAWKKEIWLKGLLAESGYELSLVARIATGALVKGGSRSEVPAQVEGVAYRY
ncbi:hypothetical protein Tco_1041447 [Tanacetum coccineum]|uniref:Uncharacterized protein n=1 Tax=Tanacetum coccineum TaxID=301880 RepID=A0ABQ5GIL6_9ASTR